MKKEKIMRIVSLLLVAVALVMMTSCNQSEPSKDKTEQTMPVPEPDRKIAGLYPTTLELEAEIERICKEVGQEEVCYLPILQEVEEGVQGFQYDQNEYFHEMYSTIVCSVELHAYGADYLEEHKGQVRSLSVSEDMDEVITWESYQQGAMNKYLERLFVPLVSYVNLMGESTYTVADFMKKWETEVDQDAIQECLTYSGKAMAWKVNDCTITGQLSGGFMLLSCFSPSMTQGLSVELTDMVSVELPPDKIDPLPFPLMGTELTGTITNTSDVTYYGFDLEINDDQNPFEPHVHHIDVGTIKPGETKEWSCVARLSGSEFSLKIADGYPEQ